MNHIYKLKFDKRRNELVVASEITSGMGKVKATGCTEKVKTPRRGIRSLTLSLLSGMMMMAHPVMAAGLPTGGQIVAGSGSIQPPSGSQMNIHQNSQNMVANWNSFDIGKGNTVQFYQPNSSAVALNRVVGGGESQIMGNLNANVQVFLVNPNGVLFGEDSSVSTAGFVASTRDIKNDDFMNRRYTFSGGQKQGAAIVSQGALTTNAGGYIVLAADRVSNSGTIRTPGGKAVLAAAERVTLQLDNGGLTSVQVSGEVVNALVENRGLISARDGQVFLTAHGRDMLMNTVLNVSGVVEAGGMHHQDGNIVLDGGDSGVVHLSGSLQADNAAGKGGKVVVQGQNILLDNGSAITATGSQGGGEVYVGGGWQGKDIRIKNADKVVMQNGARIDVSVTQQGDGGTAVLWSESFTNFRGQISAKGGENGGNGGQVETSSHGNLQAFGAVHASAKHGQAGSWLLDPEDITIVNGSSQNVNQENANGTEVFSPGAANSQVGNTTINDQLSNGTSVTIQTSSTSGTPSTAQGNITVNADINKSGGSDATLTLLADGNITVNNNITSNMGALNVNLSAANTSNGAVTIGNGVTINTNNGNLTAGTANASNTVRINITNATLNAGSGDISLTGKARDGENEVAVNISGTNTLTARNDINITGSASGSWSYYAGLAGISMNGNTDMTASNITINGSSSSTILSSGIGDTRGIHFTGGNFAFAGNTSIIGTTVVGNGIGLRGQNVFTFYNGTAVINASNAGREGNSLGGYHAALGNSGPNDGNIHNNKFILNNTNLSINANSVNASAVAGFSNAHLDMIISGTGNASISVSSDNGYGVFNMNVNASGLNGTAAFNGTTVNGTGVVLGNTSQNNVIITGNATGNGSGVDISGNSTLTNTTVNGNGTNGSGVDINGNLTNNGNTTIGGNTNGTGPGVDINGSVSGGTITGNASGDGNGVNISGNITDGNISGSAVNGNGVEVTGPTILANTTLSGSSVNGEDVKVSAPLLQKGDSLQAAVPCRHRRRTRSGNSFWPGCRRS